MFYPKNLWSGERPALCGFMAQGSCGEGQDNRWGLGSDPSAEVVNPINAGKHHRGSLTVCPYIDTYIGIYRKGCMEGVCTCMQTVGTRACVKRGVCKEYVHEYTDLKGVCVYV